MSVFVTGDIHGDARRFSVDSFYEQKDMDQNEENYVIICGDFGMIWSRNENDKEENYWLDWLNNKPFKTLFVDGNHSNHDRLDSYPVSVWHGGNVHFIRPNIIHLMRGQVFDIDGYSFFTFGGASSHDISDGILDYEDDDWREQANKLDKNGKYMYRIKGLSWWERELPSQEEMKEGVRNLNKHNNKVDFIITHSPCSSDLRLMDTKTYVYDTDILTNYLENIRATTEYKRWFFGHMHVNKQINSQDICLYEQILRIL